MPAILRELFAFMKTIAHLTDAHLDEPSPDGIQVDPDHNWRVVLDDVRQRSVDGIVFGGDIGNRSSHRRFFQALAEMGIPVRLVLGNHDRVAEVREHDHRLAREDGLYGAVSDHAPGRRTLFLDSSTGEIGVEQLAWLDRELAQSREVLIYVHHPILPVDTAADLLFPLNGRETVKARLLAHPDAVTLICGHYHMADDRSEKNLRQLITPAVSFQVRKESRELLQLDDRCFGYRIVHLGQAHLHSEVIMIAG